MHEATRHRIDEASSKDEVPGFIIVKNNTNDSSNPLYKLKGGIRGINGAELYAVLSKDKKKVLAISETMSVSDKPQFRRVDFKEPPVEFAKKASSKDFFLPAQYIGLSGDWEVITAKEILTLYRKKVRELLKPYGSDFILKECSVYPRDPLLKISVVVKDEDGIAAMFDHSFVLQKDGNVVETIDKLKKIHNGAFVPMSLMAQGGSGDFLKTTLAEELGKRLK